jgi:putative hemolysin
MALKPPSRIEPVDVRAGDLHIRLARTAEEVKASQKLRYQVFCEELAAKPTSEMTRLEREFDDFDDYCDHLLVFDHDRDQGKAAVVGTYRLMRRVSAARCGRFYSSDEFDIAKLLAYRGEILEVGRSCVGHDYRNGAIMQLLWRGIAAYVAHYRIDILFGCASLPGVTPEALAVPLAYLHHNHLAPPALRPRAHTARHIAMDRLPREAVDRQAVWPLLPPLIKGYLRLGGNVGQGAVIDHKFGTTDVCIVVKTDWVTQKYYRHYTRSDATTRRIEA